MTISSYSHVLYFQQNEALSNYSFAYSAMALAGSLSFIISNQLSNLSLRKIAYIFLPIYGLGLLLRIFYANFLISLISGFISGIGASIILLLIRTWLYMASDQNEGQKGSLVSYRYTSMQISSFIGTLLAGGLITLFHSTNQIYQLLLFLTAIGMIVLPFIIRLPNHQIKKTSTRTGVTLLPDNRKRGLSLFFIVAFLGITSALVEPILPAILRENGISVATTSVLVTIFNLFTVVASLLLQRMNPKGNYHFLFNQIIVCLAMLVSTLFYRNNLVILVVALSIMSITTAGFFIFKEVMEYDMFPKTERFIYLGLAQSGFMVGDALGAPVGSYIFQNVGSNLLLTTFAIFSLVSGLLYTIYHHRYSGTATISN